MDETEKEKEKDETENTEVSTDELSILRETLAKRDAELAEHKADMNALIDENTKLKGELQEMHDAFKNNDVSKKEKTTKELSKELMG